MSMKLSVSDGHLCNMGKMIEEMEGKLRNSLDQVNVFPFGSSFPFAFFFEIFMVYFALRWY